MATSDSFYQDIKAEVDAVIAELGTSFVVRSVGEYDPEELATATGSERDVVGLVADQQVALQLAGATGATWVAKRSLILSADAAPLENEEVEVDGEWFPLSAVMPIKPADIVVVYMLDITR